MPKSNKNAPVSFLGVPGGILKEVEGREMGADIKLVVNNEEEGDLMADLKLIRAGGDPPNNNWLEALADGTIFLTQSRSDREFILGQFVLLSRTEKSVILAQANTERPVYINPGRFCSQYTLYEIIGVMSDDPEMKQEEPTSDKDKTDGNGDRVQADE